MDEIAVNTHAGLWALAAARMQEYSLHPSLDRKEVANSHHGVDTWGRWRANPFPCRAINHARASQGEAGM